MSAKTKPQYTVEKIEGRTYQKLRGLKGTITDQNVNLLDKKQTPLMKESRGDLTKVLRKEKERKTRKCIRNQKRVVADTKKKSEKQKQHY